MPTIITLDDVLVLKEVMWPQVTFYDKQVEVIESAFANNETYVPAGNKLGKDFVTGFIVVAAFVVCQAVGCTCRIVTTSVAGDHLDLLWGEIGKFVSTARRPLLHTQGGGLIVNAKEIRRVEEMHLTGKNVLNYLVGWVAEDPEKMQGHHAEFTMFVGDEASALRDEHYKAAQGWAKRMLFIGNTLPCSNFFRNNSDAGDLLAA